MISRRSVTVVAPLALGAACAVLAATTKGASLPLWIGALALFIVAVVLAAREQRIAERRRAKGGLLALAFVVTAALGAVITLHAANAVSTAGVPDVLELNVVSPASADVVAVSERTVTYAGENAKAMDARTADAFETAAATVSVVTGQRAAAFIEAAADASYGSRSGLVQDFEAAVVQRDRTFTYVTVPLRGTDIPEMSKVTYAYDGQRTSVVEMVSATVDESHANMRIWQDGALTDTVTVYDPARDSSESGSQVQQVGFSASKLQKCLNNAGVAAWLAALIAATCAVTCAATLGAGCLACAVGLLGFTSGAISACVYAAFT